MSVQTTADTELDSAKSDIQTAIKHLSEIIIERCWGWDDFNREYRADIAESLSELIVIRERLGV